MTCFSLKLNKITITYGDDVSTTRLMTNSMLLAVDNRGDKCRWWFTHIISCRTIIIGNPQTVTHFANTFLHKILFNHKRGSCWLQWSGYSWAAPLRQPTAAVYSPSLCLFSGAKDIYLFKPTNRDMPLKAQVQYVFRKEQQKQQQPITQTAGDMCGQYYSGAQPNRFQLKAE